MWSSKDWNHRDVRELYAAARHIRNERLEQWRIQRMRAYVDACYGGMTTIKKGITIYDFWPLPGDPKVERKLATMRFMDREEIKERYAKGGIHFTEHELDQMMAKIERAKERERVKKENAEK